MLIQLLREQYPTAQSEDILSGLTTDDTSDPLEIPAFSIEIIQEISLLFSGSLNPVAPKAQRKVLIPEGLNLDEWINSPPAESSSSSEDEQTDLFVSNANNDYNYATGSSGGKRQKPKELSEEELLKVRF